MATTASASSGLIPAASEKMASSAKSATSKVQLAMQQKATSLQGEPWYREVVELRRQANDYKVYNIRLIYGHLSFWVQKALDT